MCLILDTNCYDDYCDNKANMRPVRNWVERKHKQEQKNRLVYSPTEQMEKELNNCRDMVGELWEYDRKGHIKEINPEDVGKEKKKLIAHPKRYFKSKSPKQSFEFKSNKEDWDILALASLSGAKILVTKDGGLREDFKKLKNAGKRRVYRDEKHAHMLENHVCKG